LNRFLSRWQDVAPGDLVRVWQDQQFPADLVLLNSSQQDGCCWIQTQNVDGETNLKVKRKVDALEGSSSIFSGTLECTPPSREIDEFHGYILQENGQQIPVANTSLLLRGCTLANTEHIKGLVVYTGHKTKLMMN
jgi:magnesium-transporting ATPase (P-type)